MLVTAILAIMVIENDSAVDVLMSKSTRTERVESSYISS